MRFYSPLYFLFFLGLIPIILMYLLRKQHEEVIISSNYLWDKVLKDIEANKPWQKLRKNILMILQIIFFSIVVLVLAKPHILIGNEDVDNLILVLDTSASMQSKYDKDRNAFEFAKIEIEKIIDNKRPNTEVTLISMCNNPKTIIGNSKNKTMLKNKLSQIKVTSESENTEEAISLVKALSKDMKSYNIFFYTDKDIKTNNENIKVYNLSKPDANISIDALSHSTSEKNNTALVRVTNHSNKESRFELSLYGDEKIIDVQNVSVKPNESKEIYYENIDKNINILKAEADIDDRLKIDNTRYHVVNSSTMKKVLFIGNDNVFLEKAITINNNIELYKSKEKLNDDNLKGFDLYIFDGVLPKSLPKDGNILIFNPPKNDIFKISDINTQGNLKLNNDELFRYVNLDFSIKKAKTIDTPSWMTPIVTFEDKPVILKGEKQNQKYVLAGFDIHDTDLPLKMDFPIFIQNVMDYTLSLNKQDQTSILSGEKVKIDVTPTTKEVYIIKPEGEKTKIAPPFPLTPFADTGKVGVYTIEQKNEKGTLKNYFVSNVNTEKESRQNISEDKEISIKSKGKSEKSNSGKDLKNILLLIALIILAIEWVVYNRDN
ncbi:hypothetical protein CLPU_9c00440 [Gottschalkia purinilytica]|uniref:VWFA domain-containing protein n=1 Tax=Gottschalkia purinilytica TaxID=1503 RepID=A0A0L0W9B6_GOTPU|nr:BatA and WFA domain-containing protein [Gottschalkia purinilytica]KNF08148.1 hypothetical protein CLPU_9c00440 [Gottschalkia purinilytica]